ncbi:galanin receptor 2a-like [Patiria miniata]|uniref:G-protein coupled receptors family 1 profile domain-containing protein n=1 Tax=Patiria miniata TaxID=46514 RepID=A0A913YZ78_PATMI|nr:galanin receptor 2a-like [Patiria miniata]
MQSPGSPSFFAWRCILVFFALCGNTLVIVVFVRVGRLRTLTNYFIISLAAADLITAITVIPSFFPVEGLPDDARGVIYCRLVASDVFMWTALKASVFNLIAVTLERYLAVVYPLRHKRLFSPTKAKISVALTWVIAVVLNFFGPLVQDVQDGKCVVVWHSDALRISVGVSVFLVTYLIPVLVMLVTYIRILAKIRTQTRAASQTAHRAHSQNRLVAYHAARRGVVETLFIVVLAFAVCWTPDQMMFLAQNAGHFDYEGSAIYPYFLLLALTNSCLNPVIYSIKNRSFRKSIKLAFRRKHRVGQDLSRNRRDVALQVVNGAESDKLTCTDYAGVAAETTNHPGHTDGPSRTGRPARTEPGQPDSQALCEQASDTPAPRSSDTPT